MSDEKCECGCQDHLGPIAVGDEYEVRGKGVYHLAVNVGTVETLTETDCRIRWVAKGYPQGPAELEVTPVAEVREHLRTGNYLLVYRGPRR